MINKLAGYKLAGLALVLSAGLLLLGGACSSDDGGASADDIQEVEDTFKQAAESDASNSEFVFDHVTDHFLETAFFSNREDCMANAADCIGEASTVESISDTTIDGDTATLVGALDFGTFQFGLIREDDVWKVDSITATSDDVPEGTPLVDLGLGEFVFGLDPATIPSDGNFAFHVANGGGQVHEVIVAPVPAEGDLIDLLESEEGPEPVGFKVYITPGQEVDMAFDQPFAPGRYALVCFFPDQSSPDMTPHAELGMVNEFTIE